MGIAAATVTMTVKTSFAVGVSSPQFTEGFCTESITRTSSGALVESSFNPSNESTSVCSSSRDGMTHCLTKRSAQGIVEAALAGTIGIAFASRCGCAVRTAIVAVRSGVGKVSAAMAATLLLDHLSPSAVIVSGTAGAVGVELDAGDVVIGTGVGYHDYGNVTVDGLVRTPTRDYASGRIDPAFFPAGPDLLAAARRAAEAMKGMRIREGLIVTGDAFMSSPARRTELRRELNAVAVEMEGASVAQVCLRFGVPVIVIRSITDRADGNAGQSYAKFRDTASRNAADLALATIRELAK
jgi:adenosylhomocysteine nucleosidase